MEGRIFQGLKLLEKIRRQEKVFDGDADVWTYDTHIKEIMCVIREKDGERAAGIFNFSWEDFSVSVYPGETGTDMRTGESVQTREIPVKAHDFRWIRIR